MSPERDLQIKHLEIVQDVIKRLAQNSFVVKGWSVTLFAVIFAITRTEGVDRRALLTALIPVLVFWGLDAYYLRQERLFRRLSDAISLDVREQREPASVPLFSMDRAPYKKMVSSWFGTLFSKTVLPVPVAVVAIAVVLTLL